MTSETSRVLYIVRTWVPEDQLEEWDRWHTEVHVPDVASQLQVRRAHKYRIADDNTPFEWQAQYITVYEFDSWEDWHTYTTGEEAARLRKDYADRYGSVGKIARQVVVEVESWE